MAYSLSAVLGPSEALTAASPALHDAVPLERGLALRPVNGEAVAEDGELEQDTFSLLAPAVVAYLEAASGAGRVLYVEAEFFGTGDQGAAGWEDGRLAFGPLFSHHPPDPAGAINDALRWVGVERGDAVDEFAAVGLDRRREWDARGTSG